MKKNTQNNNSKLWQYLCEGTSDVFKTLMLHLYLYPHIAEIDKLRQFFGRFQIKSPSASRNHHGPFLCNCNSGDFACQAQRWNTLMKIWEDLDREPWPPKPSWRYPYNCRWARAELSYAETASLRTGERVRSYMCWLQGTLRLSIKSERIERYVL